MTIIQQKLFTLLCEVDDICRKNNVTYYLAAGCALGAIRHGGFLPWDDDVDVYITRDNWEKLKKVIYDDIPENRNFVCEEMTNLYDNPIGRYIDKDTTLMMRSQVICGECCGIVVEFFIMDPMPHGEEAKKEHRRNMRVFTELLSPYFQLSKKIYTQGQDFDYDLYCEYEKRAETEGRDAVLNELKSKFACFPEEGADEYCMRWGQRTWTFDAKHFGSPAYVMFEGREFPTLNYIREYFRSGYGDDWMYVPSGVNQISHNISKDLFRPYQDYVDIYMPFLDREKIYEAYKSRKKKYMSCLREKEALLLDFHKFKAFMIGNVIREHMPDIQMINDQLNQKQFKVVDKELDFFYENQFDKNLLDDSICIDVGDDFLTTAIENLTLQGLYYRASKILNCRKQSGRPLCESLKKAEEHIVFCRNLSIATADDTPDPEKVTSLLDDHLEYEDTLDYQIALLWLMRFQQKSDEDLHAIISQADKAIQSLGEYGDLIRYRAWALYELGDEKAASDYLYAVNHTRNGIVWKEAKELCEVEPNEFIEDEEPIEDDEEEDDDED